MPSVFILELVKFMTKNSEAFTVNKRQVNGYELHGLYNGDGTRTDLGPTPERTHVSLELDSGIPEGSVKILQGLQNIITNQTTYLKGG